MAKSESFLKISDGYEIYTIVYRPKNTPLVHVHLINGLAVHIGRYKQFAL